MSRDWKKFSIVVQESTTSGLVDFILNASAYSGGYLTMPAAEDGNLVWYAAEAPDDNQREVGSGIYTHATRTIARTNIYASTNGGAKVNFTNEPVVYPAWGGDLFTKLDTILNLSDGGTVAAARIALGIGLVSVPASPTDTGNAGEMAFDGTYVYLCTATNTWVRWVAQTSW